MVLLGVNVPAPPDQIPPDAIVTEPFKVTNALFPQTVWSAPAFTVGAGVMVIVILSVTALQFPLPVVVNVRVTVPAAISAAVGE